MEDGVAMERKMFDFCHMIYILIFDELKGSMLFITKLLGEFSGCSQYFMSLHSNRNVPCTSLLNLKATNATTFYYIILLSSYS